MSNIYFTTPSKANHWLCLLFVAILFIGCQEKESHKERFQQLVGQVDGGTQMMLDSLDSLYKQMVYKDHPYEVQERLMITKKIIDEAMAAQETDIDIGKYGFDLLEAGQNSDALQVLEAIVTQDENFLSISDNNRTIFKMYATALMRAAFEDNSGVISPEDWMLLPVPENGRYKNTDRLHKARNIYRRLLRNYPKDLQLKWLYNLTFWWEGKLPTDHKLQPGHWVSSKGQRQFRNLSMYTGTGDAQRAGGVVLDDFTGDGLTDIVASSAGLKDVIHIYENTGTGQFNEITNQKGLSDIPGGNQLVQADYDNDGDLDLLVVRGAWRPFQKWGILPNSLLRNDGDKFVDVTIGSGLYDVAPSSSAVWWDFNNDGWLDLFVTNETVDRKEIWPSKFYLNNGDGTFKDITQVSNLRIVSNVKSVSAGDINNDGLQDLFLGIQAGNNRLIANANGTVPADWRFVELAKQMNATAPHFAYASSFTDFDNDGWEDVCVLPYDFYGSAKWQGLFGAELSSMNDIAYEPIYLYRNDQQGILVDITKAVGLDFYLNTQGFNFGDIDNDGWEDLYITTGSQDLSTYQPNRFFRNIGGSRFEEYTAQTGLGILTNSGSIAFADLDNDGDQDIYVNNGGMVYGDRFPNSLFENRLDNSNHWLTLVLEGRTCNRSAIGARVKIIIETNDGSTREINRTVRSGSSYGSNSLQLEIGLGNAARIKDIQIVWPNGINESTSIGPVRMDQKLKLIENDPNLYPVKAVSFQLEDNPNEMMRRKPEEQ
jgi:tetratricopeptide (TPR) repeat protein